MLFGIDTASVAGNKDPNWAKAKAEGPISFAIIRSNYGTSEDKTFKRDWSKIKDAGLTRGAYLFLRFPRDGKPAPSPEAQAKAMIETVGALTHFDLPPTVDVEFPGKGRTETGLTAEQCLVRVQVACDVLQSYYNVLPMLYTSARVWRDDLKNHVALGLLECPLWLARYYVKAGPACRDPSIFEEGKKNPPVPTPWGPDDQDYWWFHQFQGNAVNLPGFNGKVDMNRFNSLFKGSTGNRVKWVQKRLGTKVDGKFGAKTEKACRDLQLHQGLVSDGIVGPRTFAALCWA